MSLKTHFLKKKVNTFINLLRCRLLSPSGHENTQWFTGILLRVVSLAKANHLQLLRDMGAGLKIQTASVFYLLSPCFWCRDCGYNPRGRLFAILFGFGVPAFLIFLTIMKWSADFSISLSNSSKPLSIFAHKSNGAWHSRITEKLCFSKPPTRRSSIRIF